MVSKIYMGILKGLLSNICHAREVEPILTSKGYTGRRSNTNMDRPNIYDIYPVIMAKSKP